MSITAFAGPVVANFPDANQSANQNPESGPSLFGSGSGLLDPRIPFSYQPGQDFGSQTRGWNGHSGILVINQVPSTLAANNIVTSQVALTGVALTLTAGTGVTGAASVTNAATGKVVTGLLALDGAMGVVNYGQSATIQLWDPTKALSRAVRVVSGGDDSGGTFLISGFDIYGYPMSQRITGAAIGTATTTKAFKYIQSIVPAGTISGTALTVGTTDVIGLPMRSDLFPTGGSGVDIQVYWNGALITAATGYVAAVTTNPATTTTGDVRGTYALQSASDATKRLIVFASPSNANLATATGLVGVTQA